MSLLASRRPLVTALVVLVVGALVWRFGRDEPVAEAPQASAPATAAPTHTPAPAPAAVAPAPQPAAPAVAASTSATGVPTRTVSGHVVRSSDGTPLPGVEVRCIDPDVDVAVLSRAPGGEFRLEHVVQSATSLHLTLGTLIQDLPLTPGPSNVEDLTLPFASGFTIAGRIVDEAGQPLPGASVDLQGGPQAVSEADGRFRLQDINTRERRVVVRARAEDRVQVAAYVSTPATPSRVPEIELRLAPAGRITGHVVLPDGAPGDGTVIKLEQDDQAAIHPWADDAYADAAGAFEMRHVAPGTHHVIARLRLFAGPRVGNYAADVEGVVVTAGADASVDIHLSPAP